jgi:hypothetical protein
VGGVGLFREGRDVRLVSIVKWTPTQHSLPTVTVSTLQQNLILHLPDNFYTYIYINDNCSYITLLKHNFYEFNKNFSNFNKS